MLKHQRKLEKIFTLLLIYILIVVINIFVFAYLYDKYSCIIDSDIDEHRVENINKATFYDSLYFSGITYLTIGYGDFKAINDIGKVLVVLQGFSGILINSVITGAFLYYLLKRPRNILLSDRLYIKYVESRGFVISIRIGNKGKELVHVNRILELFIYKDQDRQRAIHIYKPYHYLDKLIYWDIDLGDEENKRLLEYIKLALFDKQNISIRVFITGTDTNSGELAFTSRYYTSNDILFIKDYQSLYKWDEYKRSKIKWENFNRVVEADKEILEKFRQI